MLKIWNNHNVMSDYVMAHNFFSQLKTSIAQSKRAATVQVSYFCVTASQLNNDNTEWLVSGKSCELLTCSLLLANIKYL